MSHNMYSTFKERLGSMQQIFRKNKMNSQARSKKESRKSHFFNKKIYHFIERKIRHYWGQLQSEYQDTCNSICIFRLHSDLSIIRSHIIILNWSQALCNSQKLVLLARVVQTPLRITEFMCNSPYTL